MFILVQGQYFVLFNRQGRVVARFTSMKTLVRHLLVHYRDVHAIGVRAQAQDIGVIGYFAQPKTFVIPGRHLTVSLAA